MIIILEDTKLVPTSIATAKKIPKKSKRIVGFFSRAKVSPTVTFVFSIGSRSIGERMSQRAESRVIKPKIGNAGYQ